MKKKEERTHETLHRLRCVDAVLLRSAGLGTRAGHNLLIVFAYMHRPGEEYAGLLAAVCYLWRMHSPVTRECAFNVRCFLTSALPRERLAGESAGVPWRILGTGHWRQARNLAPLPFRQQRSATGSRKRLDRSCIWPRLIGVPNLPALGEITSESVGQGVEVDTGAGADKAILRPQNLDGSAYPDGGYPARRSGRIRL